MTLLAGLHYDVPEEIYRRDPCPERSLTQSVAKVLLSLTPAHYRYMLQPPTRKFDVGHITHRLILGRGRELEVLPSEIEDWRTKDARTAREEAGAVGKLAVLAKDYETGEAMVKAAWFQIGQRNYQDEWLLREPSCAEVVAIAQAADHYASPDPASSRPIWLRTMIDWLPSLTRVWDYKTTALSCAKSIGASLPDWCIQAAMHERILNLLDPDNAGRREHRFVVQENYEPYALQVVRLTEAHLTIGRTQIARAEAIWARCMATDEWPAYPLYDVSPEYPAWKMAAVMEEESDD
jgi:hypothetical protein